MAWPSAGALSALVLLAFGAKKPAVWRAGRLPPPRVTTRDLGMDIRWAVWRCPVQGKRVITFRQSTIP
eukprot:1181434-Amphidinium_carterae.1